LGARRIKKSPRIEERGFLLAQPAEIAGADALKKMTEAQKDIGEWS
jgi:hypothetical protein